jgi:hypothetical protein
VCVCVHIEILELTGYYYYRYLSAVCYLSIYWLVVGLSVLYYNYTTPYYNIQVKTNTVGGKKRVGWQ